MPAITPIIVGLSLDLTTQLVAVGFTSSAYPNPLNIVGASQTWPIILTTAVPHMVVQPIHAVVAGVTGMTEANGTWILTATSPTTLAVSTMSTTGQYSPVTGVNAYVAGGTITTALTDGRIVIGEQHRSESSSPPRIIFVPIKSIFTASTQRMRGARPMSGATGAAGQTAEMVRQQTQRQIADEEVLFDVTVWGAASPPDPDLDFDSTQVVYQQLIRSCEYLIQGAYTLHGHGDWVDQQQGAKNQVDKLGHKITFSLSVKTPIVDYPLTAVRITSIDGTVGLQTPQGTSPETGWTGEIT